MQYIIFKNDFVIAVCKYKEVADAYVKFLEEKSRKRREESSLFWNYHFDSFYVKSILNDNDILKIIEKDSSEKDGQGNKEISSIFNEFEKSGTTICQKLEKE